MPTKYTIVIEVPDNIKSLGDNKEEVKSRLLYRWVGVSEEFFVYSELINKLCEIPNLEGKKKIASEKHEFAVLIDVIDDWFYTLMSKYSDNNDISSEEQKSDDYQLMIYLAFINEIRTNSKLMDQLQKVIFSGSIPGKIVDVLDMEELLPKIVEEELEPINAADVPELIIHHE